MAHDSVISVKDRVVEESKSALDELLHEGARQMLQHAIENEVAEYIERHEQLVDESGRRLVVRNGHLPERTVAYRTRQTKGCGSRLATLTMVFKLAREAEKHWRKLNGSHLIEKVIEGVVFIDGEMKQAA